MGLFNTNLQNTDAKINTHKNAMRHTVIAVAILFKKMLRASILVLIILTSFKDANRG